MEIKPGAIGFCTPDGPLGKLIAWFQGSRWSHCFLVYDVTPDNVYLIETTDFEVVYSDLKKYTESERDLEIWELELTQPERVGILMRAREKYGDYYGWLEILAHGLKRMFSWVGVTIPVISKQGTICSELVAYAYGIKDPEQIDPETLYRWVKVCGSRVLTKSRDKVLLSSYRKPG